MAPRFYDSHSVFFPALECQGLLSPREAGEGAADDEADGGKFDDSGRRPADVFVPRWRNGVPAALDFAVTSGMRADMLVHSAASPEAATQRYEERKRQYEETATRCARQGVTFVPMVLEAHGGGWGLGARRAFAVLAKRMADATGEDAAMVADQYAQRRCFLAEGELAGRTAAVAAAGDCLC